MHAFMHINIQITREKHNPFRQEGKNIATQEAHSTYV